MTFKSFNLSNLTGASLIMAGLLGANMAAAKTQQNAPVKNEDVQNVDVQSPKPAKVERIHFSEGQLYQKPGSSIRYSYSMPKSVEIGRVVTLDLELSEPFQSGDLRVTCNVAGDVSLHANSGVDNFSMAGEDKHEMQVSFTANSPGRHYIQVEAISTSSEFGAGSRYFSIPVQVGPTRPLAPHSGLKRTPSGQMVISMRATEEIR